MDIELGKSSLQEAKTTHILNSAVMPAAGCYSLEKISWWPFFEAIKWQLADDPSRLQSWIGYEQNAAIIEEYTGWNPPICRSVTELNHGDRLLIMRLKYRAEPASKGRQVDSTHFDYFEGYYVERVPVPSYIDVLNMDIYEPEAGRYFTEIMKLQGAHKRLEALQHTRQLMREVEDGQEDYWRELHKKFTGLLKEHFDNENQD